MISGVYARFVFDSPYLNYWINHYLNLGFDYIVILFFEYKYKTLKDDTSNTIKNMLVKDNYLDEIHLTNDKIIFKLIDSSQIMNWLYDIYKYVIPDNIDYLLVCDSDEYLIINDKYKTINNLITFYKENKTLFNFNKNIINTVNNNHKSKYNKSTKDFFKYYDKNVTFGIQWTWKTTPFTIKETFIDNINKQIYSGKSGCDTSFNNNKINKNIKKKFNLKKIPENYKKSYKILVDLTKNKNVNYIIHSISNILCDINDVQLVHFRQRGLFNIIFKYLHNNSNIKGSGLKGSEVSKRKSGDFDKLFNLLINYDLENHDKIIDYIINDCILKYNMHIKNNISDNILTNFTHSLSLTNSFICKKKETEHYSNWIKDRLIKNNFDIDKINIFLNNLKKIDNHLSTNNETIILT